MKVVKDILYISIEKLSGYILPNTIKIGLRDNRKGRSSWAHVKGLDGNKRSVWVNYDSIPEASRAKLPPKAELLQKAELPIGTEVQGDKILLPEDNFDTNNVISSLSTKQLEVAFAKYRIIKACKQYALGADSKTQAYDQFCVLLSSGKALKEEFETLNGKVSAKSIYRWIAILDNNNNNIESLAPSLERKSKSASITKKHELILIRMYVHPNAPKLSQAIRQAVVLMEYDGLDVPSDAKMRRFLVDYENKNKATVIAIRRGVKAAKDTVMPYIEKNPNDINFMDAWVADGHKLNFTIQHPDDANKQIRPTLIAWVDMRTLMVMGFEIMITENTISVVSAFRNALIGAANFCGVDGCLVPRALYMDNGRAFKNKFFNQESDLEHDLDGLFIRMQQFGLQNIVYAQPYNARTKIIERIFRDYDEMEKQLATYTGNSIADKPAYMMRNEKFARQLQEIMVTQQGNPTLWDAYDMISAWISIYNNRVGNGKWLNGSTPNIIASNNIEALGWNYYAPRNISLEKTNYMLQRREVKKLQKNGIKINGIWYYNPEMLQLSKSYKWNFIVYYDQMRPDHITVFYENGEFFCNAKQWIGQGIHPMACLGSDADREKLSHANNALRGFEKQLLGKMKETVAFTEQKALAKKIKKEQALAMPQKELTQAIDKQLYKGKENKKGYELGFKLFVNE